MLKFGGPGLDPAICFPGRENVLEITRLGFDTVPGLIGAKKPASFLVHYNYFTALVEKGTRCAL